VRPLSSCIALALMLAGCAHSMGSRASAAPAARLVQRLVEREEAVRLFNGLQIDQANIFSGYVAASFNVTGLRCARQAGTHFDCGFTLTTVHGTNTRRQHERRSAWRRPDGGWTTDIIEELCAAQRSALGAEADCQGIVDL
jgi:hypothetical protein